MSDPSVNKSSRKVAEKQLFHVARNAFALRKSHHFWRDFVVRGLLPEGYALMKRGGGRMVAMATLERWAGVQRANDLLTRLAEAASELRNIPGATSGYEARAEELAKARTRFMAGKDSFPGLDAVCNVIEEWLTREEG